MRRSGFTLLELILVMVVAVTLCAVILPRFSDSFPSLQLSRSTDRVFAWARKARSEAAITGLRQRLVIDPQQGTFGIAFEAKPFQEAGKFVPVEGIWAEDALSDWVKFEKLDGLDPDPHSGHLKVLEFRPDGTTSDAALLLSNGRERRLIKVVGSTSKITLEDASGMQ